MKKNSRTDLNLTQQRNLRRRLSVLSLTLATSGAAGVPAAMAQVPAPASAAVSGTARDSRVMQFMIAPGPLDSAIAEFRRISGMKVTLNEARIGTVQSPGVSGSFTSTRAMEGLLNGTGVRAVFDADGIRLELRPMSQSVAIIGEAQKLESPKYTQPLRDTPQTVIVIPQQVFLEQNAASLRDVLRNTPGITVSIGEGGSGGTSSGDNILIRGFSARNDIFIDGARDPGLVNRDAYNTEAVEVVKGPSSATGGRGSTGGSINLVTKAPQAANGITIRATGGNADYKRTTVDANHKLNDFAAVRLNGLWQDTGYPGRDVAKYRSWGFAPSLTLGLNKPTSLTLSYARYDQDNIPDWGLPTLLPDVAIAKGVTVNNLDFSNFYGIASRDYERTRSDQATATLTHKFDDNRVFRNLFRYGKNYRDAVLTPPRPATTTALQGPEDPGYNAAVAQIRRTDTKYQHRDDRIALNQSDLILNHLYTGKLRHDTEFGMEISRDRQPTYAFTDLFSYGRPPVDDLFNPTPYASYTPAYARTGAATDAHLVTVALYGFDTIKFSPNFALDIGGRWDHADVDYDNTAITGIRTHFGRTDTAFSGRAGVMYKPVTPVTLYGAVSSSFTPSFDGTLGLTVAATGVNSQNLPPEKTRNVEVGVKWDALKTLNLTFSLFDIEKTNAKTTDLAGATVLLGDQVVKGGEFGAAGNITRRWGVFGGLALMSGKVKASGTATEIGQQLAYVPHVTMNIWSTYSVSKKLTLGGGANYSSGQYFNQTGGFLLVSNRVDPRYVANAAAIQALSKYWLFSAVATYTVNRHLTVQVNGLNLSNAKYEDRGYDRHFLPGPTRQVLAGPVITW